MPNRSSTHVGIDLVQRPSRSLSANGRVLVLALCLWSASIVATEDGSSVDPGGVVESTIEELRSAVTEQRDAIEDDPTITYELVDRILTPHLDSTRVARWVLGKHWRQASPEQRQQFIDEFRQLLLRSYAVQASDYTDVVVTYLPATFNDDSTRSMVSTRVAQDGKTPVRIDYRMHNKNGGWQVYDVRVEGISLVSTFRSGIQAEINQYGIDGLISHLREKNRKKQTSLPSE